MLKSGEKKFIDETGIFYEQVGLPRAAGRIFTYLLIADQPVHSTHEIMQALYLSKGSVHTTTRLLMQKKLIEKVEATETGQECYRIKPGVGKRIVEMQMPLLQAVIQLTTRSLELVEDTHAADEPRMHDLHAFYRLVAQDLPAMLARWEQDCYDTSHGDADMAENEADVDQ